MRDKAGEIMFRKIYIFLEMIKYQHSVYVLPFVYLAAFLAQKTFPGWERLGWITLGMLGARALAMGLNRYIDREIDAKNPRTSSRALPSGILTGKECLWFCVFSAILCFLAAYHLPPLIWLLAPIILALFIFYPYTKRFTWTCHFWLGFTMGFAPLGGWVAITSNISFSAVPLMLAVASLIAGSDILYTFQDIEIDRSQGLFSFPAVFGIKPALRLVRALHLLCIVSLGITGVLLELNSVYFIGLAIATVFAVYQDSLVSVNELSKANQVFFATNAFVSSVVLIFALSSLNLKLENLPKLSIFL
jgi:4-hydroxybenzoate polyprenyltransferase